MSCTEQAPSEAIYLLSPLTHGTQPLESNFTRASAFVVGSRCLESAPSDVSHSRFTNNFSDVTLDQITPNLFQDLQNQITALKSRVEFLENQQVAKRSAGLETSELHLDKDHGNSLKVALEFFESLNSRDSL